VAEEGCGVAQQVGAHPTGVAGPSRRLQPAGQCAQDRAELEREKRFPPSV
jgi:hypothetical protein